MINKQRLLNLFIELVQIDSISREERQLADRLIDELKELGGNVREDDTAKKIKGNAGNIIAQFPGKKDYPAIILSAHMDRVGPGKGIKPVIKEGYIVSQGDTVLAGDDIIGVAVILEALKIIQANKLEHGPIKVLFSVGEEVGLLGAKAIEPEVIADYDFGIVYDADGEVGNIIYQAPSQIKFNAIIKGKAAHAGMNPEAGVNAIKITSLAISEMKLGRVDEYTTANIGVIKGGRATNIIPDLVELEGEVRSHQERNLKQQQINMQEILKAATRKYGGQVEFQIEKLYTGFALNPESDIIKLIVDSVKQTDLPLRLIKSGGGSDANVFNDRGLPTVNLATGMENVHSTEERVKIESLFQLVTLTLQIIKNSLNL